MDSRVENYCLQRKSKRTAGDMTRVFVVPRRLTVNIGDAENRWRGCRETNRSNNALISFNLKRVGASSSAVCACVYGEGGLGIDFTQVVNEGGFN